MGYIYLFVFQLVVLFLISKILTREVYLFFYRWTRSRSMTVYLFSVLFLPGTFVHELSHFFMALFLFVPVGQLELMPEYREGNLKLGSVPVAKTDPIRRFFIGVAPFIFGVAIIVGSLYLFVSSNPLMYLLLGYVIFTIGNTMFSSKKDLEGVVEFLGLMIFAVVVLVVLGVDFSFLRSEVWLENDLIEFFKRANVFLFVPILIDVVVVFLLRRRS